jgi:hypothetical protein
MERRATAADRACWPRSLPIFRNSCCGTAASTGVGQPGEWLRRWWSTLAFEDSAQQIAFQDYVDAVMDAEQRLKRVEEQISGLLPEWNLRPDVDAFLGFDDRTMMYEGDAKDWEAQVHWHGDQLRR